MNLIEKWIRTCQECNHEQEDNAPEYGKSLPDSYVNRACKKCKSESLDYGSTRVFNEDTDKEVEEREDQNGDLYWKEIN